MFWLWIRFLAAGCYLLGLASCASFLVPTILMRSIRTVHAEGFAPPGILSPEVIISILIGWFFLCVGAALHILARIETAPERQKARIT